MGVPKFYRWISERYPTLSQIVSESQIPEFDNLYLDMNGIIHNCSHPNDDDVHFRISEEQIYADIFAYIDRLVHMIRPQKVFFMAIDGVAPRAKMNQQRARRFMSARTAENQLKMAREKGEDVPNEKRFDSNCITPGTYFMTTLHHKLDEWVKHKVETDPLWQNEGALRVILSGHDCPGEGEHKIMDFIRYERSKPDYEPNTRHCMYGLDADLIMLGMCSHEPHFALLREEVKFNRPTKPGHGKKKDVVKKPDALETKFHLLHLQLFREYLCKEFECLKEKLSFEYSVENIIDDWVLMGFLIGNDFIPHLPHVHIHDDALPLLYDSYKQVLPSLDGYMNENGVLNLKRFQTFLKVFAKNDKKCFMDQMEDEEYLERKRSKPISTVNCDVATAQLVSFDDSDTSSSTSEDTQQTSSTVEDSSYAAFVSSDEEDLENEIKTVPNGGIESAEAALAELSMSDPIEDEFCENLRLMQFKEMSDKEFENNVDQCWSVSVSNAFKRHKKKYYSDKMKFGNISKNELKAQAEGYIKAIQWNLHYYYHGCVSWNWFFPFHYAPYISDVIEFEDMELAFEKSQPFRPFEQLLAVLPSASAECLPKPLQELMCDPESPIADFYPKDFSTDLNGKKQEWEAVVLVPFIDQKKLLEALALKESSLTAEEIARNTHGSHIIFTHTLTDSQGKTTRRFIDKDEFRIEESKIVHGLLPGVKQDVFFPGFPTMMHLPHYSELKVVGVKVFHMASKNKSMLLTIQEREELKKPLDLVASELIHKEVCIDWPILTMGKVAEIWTETERFFGTENGITHQKQDVEGRKKFLKLSVDIRDRQLTRYAIDTGEVKAIALCSRFLGSTYGVENGVMRLFKQWAGNDSACAVALQLVVTNVAVDEGKQLSEISINDAFPVNSKVFVMTPEWTGFGHPALVQEIQNPGKADCRVIVKALMYKSADLFHIRNNINKFNLHWFNNFEAGKRSGVDRRLLSRLTGTVYLVDSTREDHEFEPSQYVSRINIGLNLKLTKMNKEVPDYSRRIAETGYWEFSLLAIQLMMEYKNKFRDLFSYLENSHDVNDLYFTADVWPNPEHRRERLDALKEYLSEIPTASVEKIEGSSKYVDSYVIGQIERVLGQLQVPNEVSRKAKGSVNPAVIFRSSMSTGRVRPDPTADFQLMDRVCYVAEGTVVPCGMQGTIVGLCGEKIDVLFDRPFVGGLKIRSTLKQGYRVSVESVLNITFAKERKGDKSIEKISERQSIPENNYAGNGRSKAHQLIRNNFSKGQRRDGKPPVENISGPYTEWKPKGKKKESEIPQALKLLNRAQTGTKEKHGGQEDLVDVKQNAEKQLADLLGIGKTDQSHNLPVQEEHMTLDKSPAAILDLLSEQGIEPGRLHDSTVPKENSEILNTLFSSKSEDTSKVAKEGLNLSGNDKIEIRSLNDHRVYPRGIIDISRGRGSFQQVPQSRGGRQQFQERPPFRGAFRGLMRGGPHPRGSYSQRGGGNLQSQHQPGNFFGNSRSTPNNTQIRGINVNVTDLKPSTVSRPRKQRGQSQKSPSSSAANAQNVFDTLLCPRPEDTVVNRQNHNHNRDVKDVQTKSGPKKNRKPRLAANFAADA